MATNSSSLAPGAWSIPILRLMIASLRMDSSRNYANPFGHESLPSLTALGCGKQSFRLGMPKNDFSVAASLHVLDVPAETRRRQMQRRLEVDGS